MGLAAFQYIHSEGSKIIATAGSPAKRSVLRSMGCPCAVSSRDIAFVEECAIDGHIDAVLNTLTSPGLVAASLVGLRLGGKFVVSI